MKIPILFEDDNYLIINKPAGLMVHGDGRAKTPKTLTDWILKNRPEIENVGETMMLASGDEIERPGIVHRLDRGTSGALVIAKNPRAFADLKEKFQRREVQKIYHAVVRGRMKEDDGIVDRAIGRSPVDFRQHSAGRGARGELREAITRWSVLSRGSENTLVEAIPKTGRTHQIRVHFKAIHRPILGDDLYDKTHAAASGLERVALHAFSIGFVSVDGKRISVTAPYPPDFAEIAEKVKTGAL